MPDFEIDPGSYKERKPRGWRWRLPWSHERDAKLPLALGIGCLWLVGIGMSGLPLSWFSVGTALFAFLAGACFMWAFGRG